MSNERTPSRIELQKRFKERINSGSNTTTKPTMPATLDQLPNYLRETLPENYTYIIKSCKKLEPSKVEGAPTVAFDSTFYVNISSAERIEAWRTAFNNKTGTVFRITRADKVKGVKVIYHKDFHCRHADIAAIKYMQKSYAQKAGQRRNRNTNCQCLAKIRLEKARLQLSHPCEIHL
ncbi:10094_t:CDS:1, partial [Ambispora gerdemannii]